MAVSQLDAVEAAKLTTPYLSNISNDPMMHGRVIHFLNPNIKTQVGNAEGSDMTSLIYGTHNCGLGNDTQGGKVDFSKYKCEILTKRIRAKCVHLINSL